MENNEVKLIKKKKRKTSKLYSDKKIRYLVLLAIIVPLLIIIGVFGYLAYKDAKNVIDNATGTIEVKPENVIEGYGYTLRDNATDVQKEYFKELKEALENEEVQADDATIAGLICKNYVTDFYTWTNKAGQYDVGGLYYVYQPHRKDVFTQARDGFYKYINYYINTYGSDKLIEVESAEVVSVKNVKFPYTVVDNVVVDETYGITEEVTNTYNNNYLVKVNWTYKEGSSVNNSKFDKSMYFLVVNRDGVFEIIEANTEEIKEKVVVEEVTNDENKD